MIRNNPAKQYPNIHNTAYVDPTAVIIGKVSIGENVFIGPMAVLRADEPGSSIIINDNTNIQDGVIIHALTGTSVKVDSSTSISHGCIIHGPCKIGKNCFIGFRSVVFNAKIGNGTAVKYSAVIEGTDIPANKTIESCLSIKTKEDVKRLSAVDRQLKIFMKKVVKTNLYLAKKYKNIS